MHQGCGGGGASRGVGAQGAGRGASQGMGWQVD